MRLGMYVTKERKEKMELVIDGFESFLSLQVCAYLLLSFALFKASLDLFLFFLSSYTSDK